MKKLISVICTLTLTGMMFAQKPFSRPMKQIESFIPAGVMVPYDNGTGILEKVYWKKNQQEYVCKVRPQKGGHVYAVVIKGFGILIGGTGSLYLVVCESVRSNSSMERFWRLVYVPDEKPAASALPQL